GGNKILLNSIKEFIYRFKKGFSRKGRKVSIIITPRVVYIEIVVEPILGYKGDSRTGSTKAVRG
ncbi:hypothetical protein P154DRAFT_447448, partial [Amniculicola lignicola CBS 123094]